MNANDQYDVLLVDIYHYLFYVNQGSSPDFTGTRLLASYLNQKGFSTRVCMQDTGFVEKIVDHEIRHCGVKVVGLYCDYFNKCSVSRFSRHIKTQYGIPVIVGGPQAFDLKEDFFKRSQCDVVVRGEAEVPILEVLDFYLKGVPKIETINGVNYLSPAGKLVRNPDQTLIENLDALPFPNPKYLVHGNINKRTAFVLTGRGCPFSCNFCYEGHNTKKVRLRSVANVVQEIEFHMSHRKDMKYLVFSDDTFTLNPKRLAEICKAVKRLREIHDFAWFCEGHVRTLYKNPEMIPMLVDAGLARLQIGIESGSQRVLDSYNKQTTKGEIEKVIEDCAKYEVPQVVGNFIVGGANETIDTFEETKQFAAHILNVGRGILDLQTVFFWPLPNTAITNDPGKFGMQILDYESYTAMADYPVATTDKLSLEKIYALHRELSKHIETTMRNLVYTTEFSRILQQFKLFYNHKIESKWYLTLAKVYHLKTFFSLLVKEKYVRTAMFSGNVLDYCPIRTALSWEQSNGKLKLINLTLTPLEAEVFKYSTGQLSVREIVALLAPRFTDTYQHEPSDAMSVRELLDGLYPQAENAFELQVINILRKFERHYLVLFSKF